MTSLPASFPYGSPPNASSIRDASVSYRRSHYCADSSVQPCDLSSHLSDEQQCQVDDSVSPTASAGVFQRVAGTVPLTSPSPIQPSLSSQHSERARWVQRDLSATRLSGRETTPLLKRSASFTLTSHCSLAHVDYKSLSPSENTNSLSQTSLQACPGTVVQYHHYGKTTYRQTLFNCTALLVGIGMLSEPLVFAYTGWFWGTVLIVFLGIVSCYTAKLLAHQTLLDPRLRSYPDIGRKAFGAKSYLLTSSLFCFERFSVSVILVILAADTLHGVWPAYSTNMYKIFSFFILAPTVFLPLSILSFPSLLGISSTLVVIAVIFIDGLSKPDSPGSLWSPAQTSWSLGTLQEVGVSFGLVMAGFSGHVVMPSLARDMVDPSQFDHMANCAFTIATVMYIIVGYAGYVMFGSSVSDAISKDLLATPGYNATLNQLAMWSLVITPLAKFGLATRPLNITLETMLGLESACQLSSVEDGMGDKSDGLTNRFFMAVERIMLLVMSIVVSILVPEFGALMALLGSFSAFVICVIGPISAKNRADWAVSMMVSSHSQLPPGEFQGTAGTAPLTSPSPLQSSFSSQHSERARKTQRESPTARLSGRETTPLLKRSASLTLTSPCGLARVNYKSLSPPENTNDLSQTSLQASPGTVAQYHHSGRTTYGQTLFNCIAVLAGIGMLSEPLVFAYTGWFWGTVLIVFLGIVSCYTAKLLARQISLDPCLHTYPDIGQKAFGAKSHLLTSSLFCFERFSVSVILVTLAADTLHGVWPTYSANTYKIFSFFVLAPTVFMPLSVLSFPSLLGISSTLVVIAVIFIDGLSKSESPGSLWNPTQTSWSPGTLHEVGVAFGLVMAGFSGHIVIPSLARDMVDPSQFDHMANCAFTIATIMYVIVGYAGYLMFGSSVSDEISKDLLATPGYNATLNQLAMWSLVVTPLSKFGLSTRPLNITLETMLGLGSTSKTSSIEDGMGDKSDRLTNRFFIAIERIMVPVISIAVSILVPEFGALMAFMGSFSAFVISVIGPISAKIALTGRCQWYDAALLGVSILMAVWGTFSALRAA
ncbi:transmembrane amino acid transporter protein-domain-containing protein [Melanogaster broomeanus]|nr:transmembrane amino acid transporter protein-domain-containing protein [Melanogaster broomeanus]